MLQLASDLFGAVCGQNPDHTWAPGGILLPCCERCTGLYVGAIVAAVLHFWLRPRLNGRFLEVHGLFLLLMAPLGLHWVPQGPVVRTSSGVLFGFGVVTFLWAPLASHFTSRNPGRGARGYFGALLLTLVCLPPAAAWGGKAAACVLSALVASGALALGALVAADVILALLGGLRSGTVLRLGSKVLSRSSPALVLVLARWRAGTTQDFRLKPPD